MLVSSHSMKAGMATTTAITHGFAFGRQGSAARGGAAPRPAGISGRELAGLSVSSGIFEWLFLDVGPTSNVSDQRHTGHPAAPRIERRWELLTACSVCSRHDPRSPSQTLRTGQGASRITA